MLPPLFASLFFIEAARTAAAANSTDSGCVAPDATACDHRSVWSLLASCGLTLLVCVWHAVHPAVPLPHYRWYHVILYRLCLMVITFFAPELMVEIASLEWFEARRMTKYVHGRGYKWWTITHSHFALNGGFAVRTNTSTEELLMWRTKDVDLFLGLVDSEKISNPVVTEDDIMDKSSSDALGKAILAVQLSWFTTQTIVRLLNHLTVTLVELDTVCMALLTLPLIFCWWAKPQCPRRPYIFIKHELNDPGAPLKARDSQELGEHLAIKTKRTLWNLLFSPFSPEAQSELLLPFCVTWATFGALHAIAWNYKFPTEAEKMIWRVASLVLAGTPVIFGFGICVMINRNVHGVGMETWMFSCLIIGGVCRLLLVILMLASLRLLPPSAYQVIPWTDYIPHL